MTDAPERIWATVAGIQPTGRSHGIWDQSDERNDQGHWHEYIRADLVEARIAAAEAAMAEMAARKMDYGWSYLAGNAIRALITDRSALDQVIAEAREEGRREERAACAKVADDYTPDHPLWRRNVGQTIAAAIRERDT